MPAGVPVGTLAIGKPGAINAALLAAAVLALSDGKIAQRLDRWRARQTKSVAKRPKDSRMHLACRTARPRESGDPGQKFSEPAISALDSRLRGNERGFRC